MASPSGRSSTDTPAAGMSPWEKWGLSLFPEKWGLSPFPQLALEHQSLEAAGLLEEEPFRRGQRREILDVTIAPLLKALAVVYGIEPMVILKDICGANDRETEAVVRWMMDALVETALRQAK
jgi:hypothetical protein